MQNGGNLRIIFVAMKARIYRSTGSWYFAKAEDGKVYQARIKGVFKIEDINSTNPIAVGDEVEMEIVVAEITLAVRRDGVGQPAALVDAGHRREDFRRNLLVELHVLVELRQQRLTSPESVPALLEQIARRRAGDTIQRIAVSLAQRKTSQATLVRKLSGYKHNHPLLEALTEYNRLLKAQYLLNYIDDASLRNHVQRALNRGEAYHQLRRAISNVNGDRFRGNSDEEIQIWKESDRLVANAIIYFNSKVLSNLLDSFEEQRNDRYQETVKRASPVAWENINFRGTYTFAPTGELPKPHCADGTAKKPESIGPKSFFHRNFPSVLKQNNPSEPKSATIFLPSVAGVELQCVALVWRFTFGLPS